MAAPASLVDSKGAHICEFQSQMQPLLFSLSLYFCASEGLSICLSVSLTHTHQHARRKGREVSSPPPLIAAFSTHI